jgi:hypothetical protein
MVLCPQFPEHGTAWRTFREHAARLSELLDSHDDKPEFESAVDASLEQIENAERYTALRAASCVLTDLARQRWSIRVTGNGSVEVKRPDEDRLDPKREKARIREQELVKRNEQLREPATRKFIKSMEKKSIHGGHFVSIYSLIRDGRELAESLRATKRLSRSERARALRTVIDPYLQFVHDAEQCERTGFRLQDIWRRTASSPTRWSTWTPPRRRR